MVDKHQAFAREEIIEALAAYSGVTTADGATPGNNTLIDSLLIGKNDFITGKTILIGGGVAAAYEDKGAQSFNAVTGEITVAAAFSAQIKQGTLYRVLNVSSGGVVSALLAAIKAKTDMLPDQVQHMDFWSDVDDVIDLPVGPADESLPNVVVSGVPSGVSLDRVVAMLKVRAIENTSIVGDNAIDGAQNIQVRKAGGSWVNAINLANNQWTVAAATRESGDVLFGDNDLKATVDGDGTYNFKFTNAAVDLASLRLNDVIVGLRFYFSITD